MSEVLKPPAPELRRIVDLLPYVRNSRTHSEHQVAELAGSIDEFGMVGAIVVRDGVIAKGHGTLQGFRKLYEAGKRVYPAPGKNGNPAPEPYPAGMVPVLDVSGWSETQFRAYVIADNKLALNAGWDDALLKVELTELDADGFDLNLLGFSDDELDALFDVEKTENDKDPDAVPPEPIVPHSKPGDVWILGPHRVMCGDSIKLEDWGQLMGDEKADIVWTDPPYNVAYESKLAGSIKNDSMGDQAFHDFLLGAYSCLLSIMKQGAPIYVAHADTEGFNFRGAFLKAGFKLSGCLIWRKNSLVLGRSDYQWMHEPILYGWKPGGAHKWFGGRKNTTVMEAGDAMPFEKQEDGRWVVRVGDRTLVVAGDAQVEEMESSVIYHEKPGRSADHPTMKPTGLICKMLKNSARHNDIVVDAFNGSGSTMIAAEQMGMCYRGMELDPKFVDVTCRRYYDYTGRVPVHAETGESFPIEKETKK